MRWKKDNLQIFTFKKKVFGNKVLNSGTIKVLWKKVIWNKKISGNKVQTFWDFIFWNFVWFQYDFKQKVLLQWGWWKQMMLTTMGKRDLILKTLVGIFNMQIYRRKVRFMKTSETHFPKTGLFFFRTLIFFPETLLAAPILF